MTCCRDSGTAYRAEALMKNGLLILALASTLSGCATATPRRPRVEVDITATNLSATRLEFVGTLSAQFELSIANPTTEPVTIRTLELRTMSEGMFSLNSGAVEVGRTIGPNSSDSVTFATWGRSQGGYLATREPITIRGVATFEARSGSFRRVFTQVVRPQ